MSPKPPDPRMRTTLLETAARMLAADGPDALSMRKLANEAGTSTMSVYTHFGGKDELLRAVVLEGFTRLAEHLAAVARTDDPVRDLGALGMAYRRNALDNPHLYVAMFGGRRTLTDLCLADDELMLTLGTFQTLVDACQRCIAAGRIRADDAGSLAAQCWAMVHGVVTLEIGGYFLAPETALETQLALIRNLMLGLGDDPDLLERSMAET